MTKTNRRTGLWAAVALALGVSMAALPAQAARNVVAARETPETFALSDRLLTAAFGDLGDFKPLWGKVVEALDGTIAKDGRKARAGSYDRLAYERFGGWAAPFGDAGWEELLAVRPQMQAITAHFMAGYFTAGELHAAITLCEDPQAPQIRRTIIEGALKDDKGRKAPPPEGTAEADEVLGRFLLSDDGAGFGRKLGAMNKDAGFRAASLELIAAWAPGAAIRWGEKTRALEAARKAAAPAAAP